MRKITLILFFCISFLVSCNRNPKEPGLEISMLSDMVKSVTFESFSQNPNYKDQKTNQAPVPGTVYRGQLSFSLEDSQTNENLFPFSSEALLRGQFVYKNYCAVCHGPEGAGDGPLIPKYPNPPPLDSQRILKLSDKDLFLIISNGKRDMPAHGGQILPEDRWQVIWYIRKLQGRGNDLKSGS